MGAYATSTSLKQRYPGFPQSSTSFDTVLGDNITRAEGVINSTLARRYDLPFTSATIPPIIITIAEDLSAGYTYRTSFMRDSHNTSEWQVNLVDNSMDMLMDIRNRKLDLVDTSGNLIGERSSRDRIKSNVQEYTPIFGLDTATSWQIDPDQLDDISGDRT
jgi:hypothetical protein|tara:strand:+ start:358 stop:840 length:483 start_codon:yes stop_codon:yes gene_type:complete